MPEKVSTAIIAAAGQATRMWPSSKVVPKELFPLGKVPAIVYLVWELVDAGIQNIVIVTAPHNRTLIARLFDASNLMPEKLASDCLATRFQSTLSHCRISIIEQKGNYGNGTALQSAIETIGVQSCVYAFGDDIVIGENATKGLLSLYQVTGNAVLATQEVPEAKKSSFGIIETVVRNGVNYIAKIVEKPKPGATSSNTASFGRYLVTRPILRELATLIPGRDGEIWFTDAVTRYLSTGGEVCALGLTEGAWYTVGDPEGYAEAVRAAVLDQRNEGTGNKEI